ncbi:MAG: SpoIID/LytB domain-containing protein [Clostridiales Family XIII bacterium]|jgi:SpoIID/LytB domain protein|nr:SpoIID/LytB domain-containing protein [Clostridiales Family XIII bacterium]
MKTVRNILSAVLIITLLFTFTPLLPASDSGGRGDADGSVYAAAAVPDDIIRVHLSSYGEKTSFTMAASGDHTIADNDTALSGSFTVSVSKKKVKLKAGSKTYTLDSDVTISADSKDPASLIKISGGYSYPGDLRILVKSGKLKLVNIIDYETYTMGVLPYEVGEGAPAESQKAQAVAARTFAYYVANSRTRASQEHDVVNTTMSQLYNGYDASKTKCIAAVNATAGQVLTTPKGGTVYTCFSSSNGGHTELPKNSGAAATNFEYLPYKEDPYDLKYSLGSTSYSAQLTIPKTLTLTNLKNSSKQPYPMLRSALEDAGINVSGLKAKMTVKSVKLTAPRYTTPDKHCFTGADIKVTVPKAGTAAAISTTLSFGSYVDSSKIKRPFLNSVLKLSNKSKFSSLYLKKGKSSFLLAAVRYGHSAGMSQAGANQMATDGKTYEDILSFYYLLGSKTRLVTKGWSTESGEDELIEVPDPDKVKADKAKADKAKATAKAKTKAKAKAKVVKGRVNIKNGTLNIRKGAGTKYKVLFSLKKNKTVTILKTKGSWYQIKYGKKTGYANSTYIKKLK